MTSKIARRKVVGEIIKRCDRWVGEQICPGERVFRIELCIEVDGDKGGQKR